MCFLVWKRSGDDVLADARANENVRAAMDLGQGGSSIVFYELLSVNSCMYTYLLPRLFSSLPFRHALLLTYTSHKLTFLPNRLAKLLSMQAGLRENLVHEGTQACRQTLQGLDSGDREEATEAFDAEGLCFLVWKRCDDDVLVLTGIKMMA